MNFWEFKEDHSMGYYLPVPNKAASNHGGQLANAIFFLFTSLLKLIWAVVTATATLLFLLAFGLWKLLKS